MLPTLRSSCCHGFSSLIYTYTCICPPYVTLFYGGLIFRNLSYCKYCASAFFPSQLVFLSFVHVNTFKSSSVFLNAVWWFIIWRGHTFIPVLIFFIIHNVTVNNLIYVSLDAYTFENFSKEYIQKWFCWAVGFEICSFTRYCSLISWSDFTCYIPVTRARTGNSRKIKYTCSIHIITK